jgi:hypothetical protein
MRDYLVAQLDSETCRNLLPYHSIISVYKYDDGAIEHAFTAADTAEPKYWPKVPEYVGSHNLGSNAKEVEDAVFNVKLWRAQNGMCLVQLMDNANFLEDLNRLILEANHGAES